MALSTAPSFASGKSATGNNLSSQIAGQRATKRRAMPNRGGMMPSPGGMRPNPATSMAGAGIASRMGQSFSSPKPMFGGGPPPAMGGGGGIRRYMPGQDGSIASNVPFREQGPPLMSAPDMPPSDMSGGGMVAATAPPMEIGGMMGGMQDSGLADRLREKMGGNTGITGGMFPRRPGMFAAY